MSPAGLPSKAPPREVWLHPSVSIGRSSIEGEGLLADDALVAGMVVVRLGGSLVGDDRLGQLLAEARAGRRPYVDTITVDEGVHLVLPDSSPAHFGNHSCDPNLWHVGPYELVTRRAVAQGEELTLDYGTNSGASGFEMNCRCGTAGCRGVVTSEDWRRPELQQRFAGHFVPALAQRIAGLRVGPQ